MSSDETHVEVGGERVRISSPGKVVFPDRGWTKMDVVEHFVTVVEGAFRAVANRPCHLKRWPSGLTGKAFYQRRTRPREDIDTLVVRFHAAPPGPLWVARSPADVLRMVQLNCIDLHPWPVRAADQDHPDELRLDLDPTSGHGFDEVREVASVVRDILREDGLEGHPKTSGSRGIHVYVRLRPVHTFETVRRAALAIAREAERRHPAATSRWWKEEREGVFLDYNQMCRDKTVAAAYSVRETGYVSAPFAWDELDRVAVEDFPMDRFSERWRAVGDLAARLDDVHHDLDRTLARVRADEERGLGDAPWPPHYRKQPGEPRRVSPSRAAEPPGSNA